MKPFRNRPYGDILTRTSVRAYSDRKVEDEKIDTLLRAAMGSPLRQETNSPGVL